MNFLKRHLFYIACIAGALGGIALAVTGLGAMPEVVKELQKAKSVHQSLDRLGSKPLNAAIIEETTKRIEKVLADSNRVVTESKRLYGYVPLIPEVFPKGNNDARIRFMTRYGEAMAALLDSLRWGSPANSVDIDLMSQKIDREIFQEGPKGLDEEAAPDTPASVGPAYTAAGVLTKAGAQRNSEVRAHIQKALTINCYATPKPSNKPRAGARVGPPASLQYSPWMEIEGKQSIEPAFLNDIWWAQLQYWIQKDVVEAINAVNKEAGDASVAGGGLRWVGIMPVKEVVSIRFSDGYILDDDDDYVGAASGGYKEALPCGTRNTVFTNSQSGPTYDVLQFTVKLIMDQRDILTFVDALSKNRFHTLLRVTYTTVPPNRFMIGKIYGPEPVVNVVLDFETIMIPSVFHPWMPQEVCDNYDHIECPDRTETEEG